MTVETGIDLVEIERVARSIQNPRFLMRVFSEEERALFSARQMNPQTIAANFAAKEALSKALGTGLSGFSLSEAGLLRDVSGKPYFSLSGRAQALVEQGGWALSISVTHTAAYAAAVVVCYR